MTENTTPEPGAVSDATAQTEDEDARVSARADAPPTPEQEAAAEAHADSLTDDVREHYEEMAELGANIEGEGKVE